MRTVHNRVARAALTLLAFLPCQATAGEDELVLSVEPGWVLHGPGPSAHGAGGSASAWLGLTETLWLAGSLGLHPTFVGARSQATLAEAVGGIVLALDVLRTVPFAELAIGAIGSRDAVEPCLRLGLGADYFVSPALSLGGVARFRPLPGVLGGGGLWTVGLRLALRLEL